MIYGALEAGGTKMVCATGTKDGKILDQITLPTLKPEDTIPGIIDYFKDKNIAALGIASFGPVDLNPDSPTYGHITTTPKPGWADYDIVGAFKKALNIPIGFDTDVNGSLLGEVTFGDSKGLSDVIYITIGTGVGGGIMAGGKLLHGMLHPELGHMLLRSHPSDPYPGRCPFHRNCLEGMAAGPAIEDRWGAKGKDLASNDAVWELEAYYIGQALVNLILTLSPKRIILGGGVMNEKQLFKLIREETKKQLGGYIDTPLLHDMDGYIVPASLNDDQGILGCINLAADAFKE